MWKLEDRIVYRDEGWYSTFPGIVRASGGDLVVTFRRAPLEPPGNGYSHVHTRSRGVLVRSSDEGVTWSGEPQCLCADDELGQQDPGIGITSTGRLVANFFRWQAHPEVEEAALPAGRFTKAKGALWTNAGVGAVTSDDDGHTWSPLVRIKTPGPLGGGGCRARVIEPAPGLVLLPCYGKVREGKHTESYLVASTDDGRTWEYYAGIAHDPDGRDEHAYHEPFVVQTASGKLVCFMRCYVDKGRMEYAESTDNGRTWTDPVVSQVWGFPQCAIRLSDDRVFLAYGYRRDPLGVRCRVLDPECTNVDAAEELVLRDNGASGDLGYPNAVQLDDHTVLVVYYIHAADQVRHIAASVVEV